MNSNNRHSKTPRTPDTSSAPGMSALTGKSMMVHALLGRRGLALACLLVGCLLATRLIADDPKPADKTQAHSDDKPTEKPADKPSDKRGDKREDRTDGERRGPRSGGFPGGGPGPGGEGERRDWGWPRITLNEEQMEAGMAVLRDTEHPMLAKIQASKESNPEEFRKNMGRYWGFLQPMVTLREREPDLYKLMASDRRLENKIDALSRQHKQARETSPAEAEKIAVEIRKLTEEQFDVRHKIRVDELDRFEKRLVELRKRLDERQKNRQTIIDEQVQKATKPSTGGPSGPPGPGKPPGK